MSSIDNKSIDSSSSICLICTRKCPKCGEVGSGCGSSLGEGCDICKRSCPICGHVATKLEMCGHRCSDCKRVVGVHKSTMFEHGNMYECKVDGCWKTVCEECVKYEDEDVDQKLSLCGLCCKNAKLYREATRLPDTPSQSDIEACKTRYKLWKDLQCAQCVIKGCNKKVPGVLGMPSFVCCKCASAVCEDHGWTGKDNWKWECTPEASIQTHTKENLEVVMGSM